MPDSVRHGRCTARHGPARGQSVLFLAAIFVLLLPECAGDDDALEYTPTTIPSSLRPSSDDSAACNVAFYHLNAPDACTNISLSSSNNATTHNLAVLFCTRPSQHAALGSVIFLDTSHPRPTATRVFRARLIGPEALVLPMTYCSVQMAVATYAVATAAQYTLELLQLYGSFTFSDVTPMLRDIRLAKVSVDLAPATPHGRAGRHIAQQAPCEGSGCPLCRTADAPGRWLLAPEAAPLLSASCRPTAGAPDCHLSGAVTASPADLNDALMRWQPYGCSLLPPSAHSACRARLQHVCLFGDSQMRHLFNGFVNPSFNTNVSAWYGGLGPQSDKEQYSLPTYSYIPMMWGHEFGAYDLANCSTIVANFGQWPLSMKSVKTFNGTLINWPWTPSRFLRQVDVLAKQLQAAKHSGRRVWWATIGSHAYAELHATGEDFRTDPYLLLFNSIAHTVMRQHGIPVIDTHSITDTFKDLSYDGAHYKGYVGHWATAAVAHAICGEQHAYPNDTWPAHGEEWVIWHRQQAQTSGAWAAAGAQAQLRAALAWGCAAVALLLVPLIS
jgi:hypothetical protein